MAVCVADTDLAVAGASLQLCGGAAEAEDGVGAGAEAGAKAVAEAVTVAVTVAVTGVQEGG